jgi:hypothetical protein
MDGGNVRVIQCSEQPRLAFETREAIGIARDGVGQDFNRDIATESDVVGALHLAHAAAADECGDLIRRQSSPGSERHRVEVPGILSGSTLRRERAAWIRGRGTGATRSRRCRDRKSRSQDAKRPYP